MRVLRAADGTDAAGAFRDAAELAGVRRILYLGGLVDEDALTTVSPHLYARHQTGVELAAGAIPVTELRAGIVFGAGSASLALLEAAARMPVALRAPWSATPTQPIALEDLLALLPSAMHPAVVRDDTQRVRYPWSGRTDLDAALTAALEVALPYG